MHNNNNRLQELLDFLEKEPNDPFLKYALAMEYANIDLEKSLKMYEDLLKNHSDYLPTYYQAAKLYEELERNEQAEEIYKKGVELSESQNNTHTLKELQKAYQQFLQNLDL